MKLFILGFKAALAFIFWFLLIECQVMAFNCLADLFSFISDKLDDSRSFMNDHYGSLIRKWALKYYNKYKDLEDPQWRQKEQKQRDDLISKIS